MAKVPLNLRDGSALIPDGPVNRHTQVLVYFDTDTGALTGEAQLDNARVHALGEDRELPREQRHTEEG